MVVVGDDRNVLVLHAVFEYDIEGGIWPRDVRGGDDVASIDEEPAADAAKLALNLHHGRSYPVAYSHFRRLETAGNPQRRGEDRKRCDKCHFHGNGLRGR